MSLSAVSASKTKTMTFKIKDHEIHAKKLKNGDSIQYLYENKKGQQYPPGVFIEAMCFKYGLDNAKHTKIIKATKFGSKRKAKPLEKHTNPKIKATPLMQNL